MTRLVRVLESIVDRHLNDARTPCIVIVYLTLSLINLRSKVIATPSWLNGTLRDNHSLLLAFKYTNNEQSRLAQFGVPEVFKQVIGMQTESAYALQRLLFVFMAFVLFHLFLRKWLSSLGSFASVVFLAAVMPLTYSNHLQESAPLLMVMFLLALWAIRERKTCTYSALLLAGAVVNETVLILPSVYFFYGFSTHSLGAVLRLAMFTLLSASPAYIYTSIIRYVTRDNPHLGPRFQLWNNLEGINTDLSLTLSGWWSFEYLNFVLIFGVLWIMAFCKFKEKPLFLRRASLMIPLFVAAHFITGCINESRQMIPLAYIVLPMAMLTLFGKQNPEVPTGGPSPSLAVVPPRQV